MDADLYDEFGNYIGPDIDDDDDEEEEEEDEYDDRRSRMIEKNNEDEDMDDDVEMQTAVVLHEDKRYYPTSAEVFGPDVETIVHEEDAQALNVPLVAPIKRKKFEIREQELPETTYKTDEDYSFWHNQNKQILNPFLLSALPLHMELLDRILLAEVE